MIALLSADGALAGIRGLMLRSRAWNERLVEIDNWACVERVRRKGMLVADEAESEVVRKLGPVIGPCLEELSIAGIVLPWSFDTFRCSLCNLRCLRMSLHATDSRLEEILQEC